MVRISTFTGIPVPGYTRTTSTIHIRHMSPQHPLAPAPLRIHKVSRPIITTNTINTTTIPQTPQTAKEYQAAPRLAVIPPQYRLSAHQAVHAKAQAQHRAALNLDKPLPALPHDFGQQEQKQQVRERRRASALAFMRVLCFGVAESREARREKRQSVFEEKMYSQRMTAVART